MSILDTIREKKNQFRAKQAERASIRFQEREAKLAKINNERLKAQAVAQQNRELAEEKRQLSEARRENFNNSFFGKLGNKARENLSKKSGRGVGVKLNTTGVFSNSNSIYTQGGGFTGGNSPFFATSKGSDPFTLGDKSIYFGGRKRKR